MATYKVIQDVEAEDKLVGPLTLRQFIFAGIAAISGYLGFVMATKGAPWGFIVFGPITLFFGFFAFPWGKDQPTEVWALAKIRFFFKPRRRIWDQSGTKELVTITVPKKIERHLTNGLDQDEVNSRLNALASTIDSRGWAIKNVNLDIGASAPAIDTSDRLVQANTLPQVVGDVDVRAADDIMDEHANPVAQHFDTMITASMAAHRQQLLAQMQTPPASDQTLKTDNQPSASNRSAVPTAVPQPTTWFTAQSSSSSSAGSASVPQAATPTAEEEAMVARFKLENDAARMASATSHLKTIKTPGELLAEDAARRAVAAAKPAVTAAERAAIINLAQNDDLDVATIARQAHKQTESSTGEVVIPLR